MSDKKIEEKNKVRVNDKPKSMYTYSVDMIVSVFAENEEAALSTLDENGGFVSYRNVEIKDVVAIYDPKNKD